MPLDTRLRRYTVFTLMYLSEGLPIGFSTIALAAYLRLSGASTTEVGAFVAAVYAPWAFKWAWAPLVDLFWVERLGQSRSWILLSQMMMILTMAVLLFTDLTANISLLISLTILHNIFAATQDVAIDAMAVRVLPEEEIGTANGLMFGAQYVGIALGGSGALFITGLLSFPWAFAYLLTAMSLVLTFVTLPLIEPPSPPALPRTAQHSPLQALRARLAVFFTELKEGVLGRGFGPIACAIFVLFPPGAVALSLAIGTTMQVDLKMDESTLATVALFTNGFAGLGAFLGGLLADRVSSPRLIILASYLATASLTLYIASIAGSLTVMLFATLLVLYYFCFGLHLSAVSGLCMRLSNPAVAATQFTAYMALHNLPYSYSSAWQGAFANAHGYAATLRWDAVIALSGLLILYWVVPKRPRETSPASTPVVAPFAGPA